MIHVRTERFEIHDHELKKLLGLPIRTQIDAVEVQRYSNPSSGVSFIVVTARRPAKRRAL